MPELDPELARAVSALRDHRAPPPDAKARVHARLEAALIGPGPELGHDAGGLGQAGGASASISNVLFAAKVVAATAGLAAAGLLTLKLGAVALAPSPSPTPVADVEIADDRGAAAIVEPTRTPTLAAEPAPATVAPTGVEPRPAPTSEPAKPSDASASTADPEAELAAELALIDAARRGTSPHATLEQLREHERRFPKGTLRDERDALWAIASCAGKDFASAIERRDAILVRRPTSPLLDRIAKACPDLDHGSVGVPTK